MNLNKKHIAGFTLIELVFVMVLISIIAVVCSRVLTGIYSYYITSQRYVSANNQADYAMDRMMKDFRGIPSAASVSLTSTATSLTFTDSSGTSRTYTVTNGNLMLGTQVLASGVASINFTYYNTNGTVLSTITTAVQFIRVTLTMTNPGNNFTLISGVYLWNL